VSIWNQVPQANFDAPEMREINLGISGLLRFVLTNVSLPYGKYLMNNVRHKHLGWGSFLKSGSDQWVLR
jgi:hypothetical protein